jgi:hypothetical protein
MSVNSPTDRATQPPAATFTELKPASGSFVGKQIFRSRQISDYPNVLNWRWQPVSFDTLDDLETYLQEAQRRNACLVWGVPAEDAPAIIYRRIGRDPNPKLRGIQPGFNDSPKRVAVFDLDNVELGEGHDWTRDPKGAVHSIIAALPEPWPRISYISCFTSTHGLVKDDKGFWTGKFNPRKVRCRIFIMLDRAITCAELKTWTMVLGKTLPALDPTLSNSIVQPIYTARAQLLWDKEADVLAPLGVPTCWLHRGEIDVMPVPPDLEKEAKFRRAEGGLDVAANHPSADAALLAIGKDGKVYGHLLAAAKHLARQETVDPADKQAVDEAARRIHNTVVERLKQFEEEISRNLEHGRRAWADVYKYTQERDLPLVRYAKKWLLRPRSRGGPRKTIERTVVARGNALPLPAPGLLERVRAQLRVVADGFFAAADAYHAQPASNAAPVWLAPFPVGSGKSTVFRAVGAAFIGARKDEGTVVYAVPRHKLGEEQAAAFASEFPNSNVRAAVWRGMEAIDPEEPEHQMCRRPDDLKLMNEVGLSRSDLCQQGRGKNAIRCPFFDRCGHQRQKQQEADIWFIAHETLAHTKPKAIGNPRLLFIDENPIDAFLVGVDAEFSVLLEALKAKPRSRPISKRAVEARYVRGESGQDTAAVDLGFWRQKLHEVLSRLPDGPVPREALVGVFTPGRCAELYRWEWRGKVEVEIDPRWNSDRLKAELVRCVSNKLVLRMAALWKKVEEGVRPGAPALLGRIKLETDNTTGARRIVMLGVKEPCEPWDKVPTMLADATGNISIIKAVWPAAEEKPCTEPIVTPFVKVEQVVDVPFGIRACAPAKTSAMHNENESDARRARLALDVYASVLAQGVRYGGQPVGLVTYKNTEEFIRESCLGLPPWLYLTHYGAETGTNAFSSVRFFAVVGRPLPKWEEVALRAEALFGEAIPASDRKYAEVDGVIPTKPDAAGRNAVRVKQWRGLHPNAELVRRSITETALVQAIGRVRPLQRTAETPVLVRIFTDVPVPELGEVVPRVWAELRPSTDEVMFARHGVMLENSVDAANVGSDVVKSANALKKDREGRYQLSGWWGTTDAVVGVGSGSSTRVCRHLGLCD